MEDDKISNEILEEIISINGNACDNGNKPIPSESELRVHKKIHEHDIEIKIEQ